jgi:hypothetical protein
MHLVGGLVGSHPMRRISIISVRRFEHEPIAVRPLKRSGVIPCGEPGGLGRSATLLGLRHRPRQLFLAPDPARIRLAIQRQRGAIDARDQPERLELRCNPAPFFARLWY